jgi:hypothetical protein
VSGKFWEWSKQGFRYQAIQESDNRIRLWFLIPGETVWDIGHTIDHGSMPANDAAAIMRRFIMGDIDVSEYRHSFAS